VKILIPLLGLCLAPALAYAQVVVNPAALQQLAGIAPASPAPLPAPLIKHHRIVYKITRKPAAKPPTAATVKPAIVAPAIVTPAAMPATPVIAKPAPPPGPVILHFALGSADLPPGAAAVLKPLCGSKNFIAVNATAPGSAADPSVAMRLSLSRAFAVRDALTACGVKSTLILPRALGSVAGHDEDITEVSEAK
jgi:hypothetical protein